MVLLSLLLWGCGQAIREEGTRVTQRQHAVLIELYDGVERGTLAADAMYAFEDRLQGSCLPLNRYAFSQIYPKESRTEYSLFEKVFAILECRHAVDIVCGALPKACARWGGPGQW